MRAWTLILGLVLLPCLARAATVDVGGADEGAVVRAIAGAAAGDLVHVPAGTYDISKSIIAKSNISITGDGVEKTVLRFVGEKDGAIFDLTDCHDLEISGICLDGNSNAAASAGIFAFNAQRLNLHHLLVRHFVKGTDFGPIGIYFKGNSSREKGVTQSVIADCSFDTIGVEAKYGSAIRIAWGSASNRVLRNTIRNCGRGGIFVNDGSTDVVIQHNTVADSKGEGLGIELWNGCHRGVVEDNQLDHWLSLDGSDYCAVRRNVVSDKSGAVRFAGLELVGSNYCVITDNRVDGGQHIGISISNRPAKNYVYWAYNSVRGCDYWGAQLQGEQSGIDRHYFFRCGFSNTTVSKGAHADDNGHGLRFNGNVRHVTFDTCEFVDNARVGVQFEGENLEAIRFLNCAITGNKGAAIRGGDAARMEWNECKVVGNADNRIPLARDTFATSPKAEFGWPAELIVGAKVQFSNTSKPEIDGVLWDFNDGVPSVEKNPVHVFERAGEYRVALIVWNRAGQAAHVAKVVVVRAGATTRPG